jgi:hypothetical protein
VNRVNKALYDSSRLVIQRGIPWAMIFGNHDQGVRRNKSVIISIHRCTKDKLHMIKTYTKTNAKKAKTSSNIPKTVNDTK